MKRIATVLTFVLGFVLALGQGFAFQWEPFNFPSGDQRYVLEVRNVDGDDAEVSRITIDIRDEGGLYSVDTTMSFRQEGLTRGQLDDSVFGGSSLGMFAFGPMMLFGPSFMMLPMLMMGEEIRVRAEPLILMGMGRLYMDSTIDAAGHECVLMRFETAQGDDPIEFAVAENLPFPCLTRYSSGSGYVEVRLVEASF